MKEILQKINEKQPEIHSWLNSHEKNQELPLTTSVDIRHAGFKVAAIDTNLFPAGFNNLCEHGLEDAVSAMRKAVLERVPHCKNVLIIAEEHTRNTWYLENVRILQNIIQNAGFHARVATFLNVQPIVYDDAHYVQMQTAAGKPLRIYSIRRVVADIEAGTMRPDLVIMNNDLTTGIPEILKNARTPIYPAIQAGWHSRLKSHHFCHTTDLMREFGKILNIDPWLFTCLDSVVDRVDVNDSESRSLMADAASDLFKRIQNKYKEHNIEEKPFVFLKADKGTYGMGVMAIEDPRQILDLNRRAKNQLRVGKGSQVISRYLLQEGVPSSENVDNMVGEACIYQISNEFVGGFYRVHGEKTNRQNLNARGMSFKKMCPHSGKYGNCGVHTDNNVFDLYRILARIAGIASHREILNLQNAIAV